jgi:hypothetical protein
MKEFIKAIESGRKEPDNPITEAIGILELSASEYTQKKVFARFMSLLQEIHSMVESQSSPSSSLTIPDAILSVSDLSQYLQDITMPCDKCGQTIARTSLHARRAETLGVISGFIYLCPDCAENMRESGEII